MAGVGSLRFLVLNGIGALLWAVCVGVLGYLLAGASASVWSDMKHYEWLLLAGIAAAGFAVWLGRQALRGRG